MTQIHFDELKSKLQNPAIPDYEIEKYLVPARGRPFSPGVALTPNVVDVPEGLTGDVLRGALNDIVKVRRQAEFNMRIASGESSPVLVAEGDSWFHFPLPSVDDIVQQLSHDFLIWTVAGAGETAAEMVRSGEYLGALNQHANRVAGFLFSAAGNDVIGADANGNAAIDRLLKNRQQGKDDAASHINSEALASVLGELERNYDTVVTTIRRYERLRTLPIFIHGYDYAVPGGYAGDPRHVVYADQGEWLGTPMRARGISETALQRKIIVALIDALYRMLNRVAQKHGNIYVVNARGRLTEVARDWEDEIHGTTYGFGNISTRFKVKIKHALGIA